MMRPPRGRATCDSGTEVEDQARRNGQRLEPGQQAISNMRMREVRRIEMVCGPVEATLHVVQPDLCLVACLIHGLAMYTFLR